MPSTRSTGNCGRCDFAICQSCPMLLHPDDELERPLLGAGVALPSGEERVVQHAVWVGQHVLYVAGDVINEGVILSEEEVVEMRCGVGLVRSV